MEIEYQEDIEIWNAFRRGDEYAFSQIYERYFSVIYAYGKRYAIDDLLLEDIIQELFVTLWRTRDGLSEVDNIKFYLFRCIKREIVKLKRKEERAVNAAQIFWDLNQITYQDIDQSDSLLDLTQRLTEMIQRLPPRQQEVITLRYYDNLSNPEIALLLGMAEKTVRNTLYNALTHLKSSCPDMANLLQLLLVVLWS